MLATVLSLMSFTAQFQIFTGQRLTTWMNEWRAHRRNSARKSLMLAAKVGGSTTDWYNPSIVFHIAALRCDGFDFSKCINVQSCNNCVVDTIVNIHPSLFSFQSFACTFHCVAAACQKDCRRPFLPVHGDNRSPANLLR
jgi:hypothetical protein